MPDPADPRAGAAGPVHRPVLLRETLHWLDLAPGLTVVDGTVGAAGHASAILNAIGPSGVLIGLDRDPLMLAHARQRLTSPNAHLIQSSYSQLTEVLQSLNRPSVDRVLLDLGLSSDQLADRSRGFSFQAGGPLDLRFDPSQGIPAWQLLAQSGAAELERIFSEWGEERFSAQIAAHIDSRKSSHPVRTAADLVQAVEAALPRSVRGESRKHPATRVFQALRIAVNEELEHLRQALEVTLPATVAPGGRVVIITFHSLEDRLVKIAFRGDELWENLTPKPIAASATEQKINPRSRTAKLRAARRRPAPD